MRLNYATGYGRRVHILAGDSSRLSLCGVVTHDDWVGDTDPEPGVICKSCYNSAKREGLIDWTPCTHCGGTGREPVAQ